MNRKIIIPLIALFLFSCEKSTDNEILKFYGDAYEDIGYSVAKTQSGYLIAGQYTQVTRMDDKILSTSKKMALITIGAEGSEIRKDTLGGKHEASGAKVIALDDGTSVLAGTIYNSTTGQDLYLARFAPGGEGVTLKIFRWPDNQYSTDIIQTSGGFVLLGTTDGETGTTNDTGNRKGKKDILLMRLSNTLDSIRTTHCGFPGNDEGAALKQVNDDLFVVAASTENDAAGLKNIYLLTVNSFLNSTNPRLIEGPGTETAADFEIVNDGFGNPQYYLIAGNSISEGAQSGHIWKIPFDEKKPWSDHPIIIDPEETSPRSFTINAMCKYKTNSFVLAGQYGTASGGDMLIFVADANGYADYGRIRKSGGTGSQSAYDVITNDDDIIAVGKNSYENNSLITFMKFGF
ncbi:MAG: hypothetical protein ACM3NR_04160 [Methanosarcina sp.]